MSLSDTVGDNLDPDYDRIVVVFNADDAAVVLAVPELAGRPMALHPVLAASADPVVAGSSWDGAAGAFTVPGRTTAVFVQAEGSEPAPTPAPEPTVAPTAEPTAVPTDEPAATVQPTATAVSVAVATAEAQPTAEANEAMATEEIATVGDATPAAARSEVTAVALLVIIGAVGAAAGIIAWLRGRKVE